MIQEKSKKIIQTDKELKSFFIMVYPNFTSLFQKERYATERHYQYMDVL